MTDLLLDSEGMDMMVVGGDLAVGNCDAQHQALLLVAHQGEWKQHPTAGVGLEDVVNDHEFGYWRREIIDQFESDGMRLRRLKLDSRGLEVEGEYVES